MKKIKNKKIVIPVFMLFVLVVVMAIILVVELTTPKDVSKIVGETISLEKTLQYCDKTNESELDDVFSKSYTEKVQITIESIDEVNNSAKIIVKAPPIKELIGYCIENSETDDVDSFMDYLSSEISNWPEEHMTESEIECRIESVDGVSKIVVDEDLYGAVFPGLSDLYKEVLLEMLEARNE